MPSSLKQKLFYGLHHKKSESTISAPQPQPSTPEKAAGRESAIPPVPPVPKKSAEGAQFVPDARGRWQHVHKEADTAGHRRLPEALRYLSLNDERLRTSTIDRSDPAIASTNHRRNQSENTVRSAYGGSEQSARARARASSDSSRSRGVLIGPAKDPYAEGYANKNISRDEAILAGDLNDSRAIRAALDKDRHNTDQGYRRSEDVKRSRRQVPVVEPEEDLYAPDAPIPPAAVPARSSSLRKAAEPAWPLHGEVNQSVQLSAARRSSTAQRKPLPPTVPEITVSNASRKPSSASRALTQADSKTSSSSYSQAEHVLQDHLIYDSSNPVSLDGVVDLRNTEDTREYTSYAPALTHETVQVDTHEILHQQITREIHNYDVYHRVLPIMQVEVLPPRHYVPDPYNDGGLIEISPKQILGGEDAHWKMQKVMQDALDNHLSLQTQAHSFSGRRPFTARTFDSSEGDFKAFADEDGCAYTEQTWVHHPTLQDGGEKTGQTVPFHFRSKSAPQNMAGFDFGLDGSHEQHHGPRLRHKKSTRYLDTSTWI